MNARPTFLMVALVATLVPTAVATAKPKPKLLPQQQGFVDLRSQANVTIVSAKAFDEAGTVSANAGDVNGDGIDDVIVGAPGVDRPGHQNVGAAYVVFGRRTTAQVRRASLTARGFRILGGRDDGNLGVSVAPAGDVDGDGLDDVVVGGDGGSLGPVYAWRDGEAWIVKGKRDGRTVDLAAPPPNAVTKLVGPPTFGLHVAGGEDVDGDGRPDVAVAAASPQWAIGGKPEQAGVFVVRGGAIGGVIDVRELGDRGIVLRGVATPEDRLLSGLTLVRDMNGDGRAEVGLGFQAAWMQHMTGMPGPQPPVPPSELLARVIYGLPAPATVDVSADLGDRGFAIQTSAGGYRTLQSIAGGGDVNGDGRGDLVLGDREANVVFGGAYSGTIDVTAGAGLELAAHNQAVGTSVAIIGDANGDGLDDVLVSDHGVSVRGRKFAGAAYLVHGRATPGAVDVGHLGSQGFVIAGAQEREGVGSFVSSAGDFNGDGRADMVISSYGHMLSDYRKAAYIVYGTADRR